MACSNDWIYGWLFPLFSDFLGVKPKFEEVVDKMGEFRIVDLKTVVYSLFYLGV
jgi:hypothetical protein